MDDGLRAELLRRMEKDQVARRAFDSDAVREVDGENLPWLTGVLDASGWPGTSLAGKDGAHAAWLLVQHMDADPGFQRRCLELMTVAAEAGEASRTDLAYLTDRVLLAEGGQQVYGTQVIRRGGAWKPRNLGDPDNVDERRAAAGMRPLADYLQGFTDRALPAAWLHCGGCGARVTFEPPEDGEPVTVTCGECGLETTVGAMS
jgi:hypothetical protein